jgi:hypothetical protein
VSEHRRSETACSPRCASTKARRWRVWSFDRSGLTMSRGADESDKLRMELGNSRVRHDVRDISLGAWPVVSVSSGLTGGCRIGAHTVEGAGGAPGGRCNPV